MDRRGLGSGAVGNAYPLVASTSHNVVFVPPANVKFTREHLTLFLAAGFGSVTESAVGN